MFDFINSYLREKYNMNLPNSDTLLWKIFVYIALGIVIFILLQTTRLIFTNSIVFTVLTVILTLFLIYLLERNQSSPRSRPIITTTLGQ